MCEEGKLGMNLLNRVKVGFWTIVIAAVVAAIAFGGYDEWGRPDPRTDVSENVTVHAQFFPERGTYPIEVKVFAEGELIWEDALVSSPWFKIFVVPRGVLVLARFNQPMMSNQPTKGNLKCRVDRTTRRGIQKERQGAGSLICEG